MVTSVFNFSLTALGGGELPLRQFAGRPLLIVNTASECGFTPQYQGLEALHRQFAARGLVVIGCPCNQFGAQEPGSASEIATFCEARYGVTFPLSAKLEVNGPQADPLFQFLKNAAKGVLGSESVKWNFTKFLVARDGTHVDRFAPTTAPEALVPAIEAVMAEP
ncbi:MAG: glutathione peroxidase [Zoogloeaceae bacterium]|nr:glutathione peroxidase [Zoogloeaceae bacterium]